MKKVKSLISFLLDVNLFQDICFCQPHQLKCMYHGCLLFSLVLCAPIPLPTSTKMTISGTCVMTFKVASELGTYTLVTALLAEALYHVCLEGYTTCPK